MNYKDIKEKLLQNGFILLEEEYKNSKIKMNMEKDGYKYYISWNGLTRTWNPKKWGINNPYSIENLKLYIKRNNYKCELISTEYDEKKLKLLCECGNIYECSLNNLICKKQETCPNCSRARSAKLQIKDKYLEYLKKENIELLEKYKGCKYYHYCKTKDNYIIRISPYVIYNGGNILDSLFDIKNKYVINNIKNYININDLNVELLSKEYKGHHMTLKLKCNCGNIFYTSLSYFMSNHKIYCDKCSKENSYDNRIGHEEDIFNKYGLQPIEKYKGISKRIYCLNDDGYYVYCSPQSLKTTNSNSTIFHSCNKYIIENIKRFIQIQQLDCELISIKYKNSKDKLKFKCSCGNIYYNTLYNIRNGIGQKCKGCGKISVRSKMEEFVGSYLDKFSIKYYREKIFENCKDKYCLPFDFYLPQYNICIECQGIQHYEIIDYFGGEKHLEYTKRHDKIKREYCEKHNIELLEISYIDFKENNIENIINKALNILY